MAHDPTPEERREKITGMINEIGTAMMVTHSTHGSLHGRPMATAELDETWRTLWFATRRDSGKVDELEDDARVCLTYVDAQGREWVSVSGRAKVVNDRKKAEEFWSDAWKNWFEGPEDPQLVLIEVEPDEGEY